MGLVSLVEKQVWAWLCLSLKHILIHVHSAASPVATAQLVNQALEIELQYKLVSWFDGLISSFLVQDSVGYMKNYFVCVFSRFFLKYQNYFVYSLAFASPAVQRFIEAEVVNGG